MSRPRHHPGALTVLAILAWRMVHTVPARTAFFARWPSPHPGWAWAYVRLLPVLNLAVVLLLVEGAWDGTRWGLPRPRWAGVGLLAASYGALVWFDYHAPLALFPGIRMPATWLQDVASMLPLFLLVGGLAALINGLETARAEAALRAREEHAAADEARARLVLASLDPHIIFNVLSITAARVPEAEELIDALARYIRGVLGTNKATLIPLAQERQIIADFLAVLMEVTGGRMRVEWDWDEALDQHLVPALGLQTLVENAVKHGMMPEGGTVRLVARGGERLTLAVINSGAPLGAGQGHGLGILRARLNNCYGAKASFVLERRGLWTHAEISLPRGA